MKAGTRAVVRVLGRGTGAGVTALAAQVGTALVADVAGEISRVIKEHVMNTLTSKMSAIRESDAIAYSVLSQWVLQNCSSAAANVLVHVSRSEAESELDDDILIDMVEHAQAELVDERWKPKPPNTVLAEMLCAFESVRNYIPPAVSFFDDVILVTAEEWKHMMGMPRKKKKEASKEGWFVTKRSRKGRREARQKKQQNKKLKKFADQLHRKGK